MEYRQGASHLNICMIDRKRNYNGTWLFSISQAKIMNKVKFYALFCPMETVSRFHCTLIVQCSKNRLSKWKKVMNVSGWKSLNSLTSSNKKMINFHVFLEFLRKQFLCVQPSWISIQAKVYASWRSTKRVSTNGRDLLKL